MTSEAPSEEMGALEAVGRHLDRGALVSARETLLPVLDRLDAPVCALAARLLRAHADATRAPAPDAMAAALDRMLALIESQEAQILTLKSLLEQRL